MDLARLRAVVEEMSRDKVIVISGEGSGYTARGLAVGDAAALATFDRDTLLALLGEVQRARDATAFCSGEFPCEASTMAASLECERNDLLDAVERGRRIEAAARAVVAHDCGHRGVGMVVMDPLPMCNECADTQGELEDALTAALDAADKSRCVVPDFDGMYRAMARSSP